MLTSHHTNQMHTLALSNGLSSKKYTESFSHHSKRYKKH